MWEEVSISNVTEIVSGGTPKSAVSEYWGGEIKWITPKDMGRLVGFYVSSTSRTISRTGLSKSSAKLVPPNSVILSTRAPIGHLAINEVPMAFNQGCRGLIPTKHLDVKFLYYFLDSKVDLLNGLGTGTTFKELSKKSLSEIRMPLPPLEEQKRIVAILDEAFAGIDKAIENTEKNLANTKELFGSYLNNIFTQKGEGWVEKSLTEICDVRDGTHDSPKYVTSGIPFVTQKNIKLTGLSFANTKFISNRDHDKFYKRSNVSEGDVLISMIGANRGMTCIVDDQRVFSIKNVGLIKESSRINQLYLLYFMKSSTAQAYIEEESRGGAQPFIGLTKLRNFPIPIAPLNSQSLIVNQLKELDEKSSSLGELYQQKLTALKELKQSLLQKAFTGELTASNIVDTTAPEYTANIIAIAFARHVKQDNEKTFGHVKTQKILHLIEAVGGIDLGREPIKDAAGPNDFEHMSKAEEWAKENKFFKFVKRDNRYHFVKLSRFDKYLSKAVKVLDGQKDKYAKIIDLLVPLNSRQAELVATVHAAWNNLLLDGKTPTDDDIIHEARENWHSDKLKIPRHEFVSALDRIRREDITPVGSGKRVKGQEILL